MSTPQFVPTNTNRMLSIRRREPDLDRPLPPLPPISSSVEEYNIPALRTPQDHEHRHPSSKHNRSFSHPFPSLFGGRKSVKKITPIQERAGYDGADDDSINGSPTPGASPVKRKPLARAHSKPDLQPATGNCMTCNALVRWPHEVKVFRCSHCLTINDLEPFTEQKEPSNTTSDPTLFHARARQQQHDAFPYENSDAAPLSIERTRYLIEHCLQTSFRRCLEESRAGPKQNPLTRDRSFSGDRLDASLEVPKQSQQMPAGIGASQQGAASSRALRPQATRLESSESFHSTCNYVTGEPTSPAKGRGNAHPATVGHQIMADSAENTGPMYPIFRELEQYIYEKFSGCDSLNAAFSTAKPVTNNSDTVATSTEAKSQAPILDTPSSERDVFLSDLDAKTLLLGDVAENGSWWSGGRAVVAQALRAQTRERSPERSRGLVHSKTSKINWNELSEWYRLVLNAGERWKEHWQVTQRTASPAERMILATQSMSELHREVMESQTHLQRALLKATENLLKRPRRPLKYPEDCRFLLMLLANPLLTSSGPAIDRVPSGVNQQVLPSAQGSAHPGAVLPTSPTKRQPGNQKRPGALGHHSGIIKRILGLIANLSNETHQSLVLRFSRLSDSQYTRLVDMVGTFITYRLSRQQSQKPNESLNPTDGLVPSFSDGNVRHAAELHAALGVQQSSSHKITDGKPKLSSYGEDWQVRAGARVMALLFQANNGHISRKRDAVVASQQPVQRSALNPRNHASMRGQILPISHFYNSMLDYADLLADFETWEGTKKKFTFCQYPFFLSIWAKIHILEYDARRQMQNKAREAFFDSILTRKAISQYLVLKVRRDCLVDDSLRGVSEVVGSGSSDIKKGLRIDFVGEEGIDAGGLRKEWFLLLVREIFDPNHGLFVYDEDSHYCYFNSFCFESSEQFFLVGILLGLAIYNSTILDIAFPPFVFKKMLASAPPIADKLTSTPKLSHIYSLEDLAELHPALARGLQQLLEYDGDVQETFCRDFVAETSRYGELIQVPLCPGGEKRAVTNSNRREFVDLYVHYLLDTAVARQYEPFKRGFFTVCGGNALSLFQPEEIELLVRGSDEALDISSLRAVATYENWPSKEGSPSQQPPVVWFWEFFEDAEPAEQRKILSFITGSDRIPAMGATNLVIKINLLKASPEDYSTDGRNIERFPSARTCFNTLNLYKYSNRHNLEQKLWMAVTGSEGFGLK